MSHSQGIDALCMDDQHLKRSSDWIWIGPMTNQPLCESSLERFRKASRKGYF